jgi:hypothetical protein
LAGTALERTNVSAIAGLSDTGVPSIHDIGVTLALSNGVSEGIAAIQQDLVLLERTMAADAVGLEVLLLLADQ